MKYQFHITAALAVALIGSALGAAGCADEAQPEPKFNVEGTYCATCAALTATPIAGVAECAGACKSVPASGDSFKCVKVNGQDKCVSASEVFCSGGVDEDVDSATDCTDTDCNGKQCGVGANNVIKTCSPAGQCVDGPCVPSCAGKVCGPDGCGGTCAPGCAAGNQCNNVGQCVAACTPNCAGKQCSDNGCGVPCGACAAGQQCSAAGQCFIPPCPLQCSGKACGDNGCGGSCGTCVGGNVCSAAGQCVAPPCQQACGAKVCGPDNCSGSCGTCQGATACNNVGQCVCAPQCAGKQCGPDGCGGQCGACAAGKVCNNAGQCVDQPCAPNCAGKTCGGDGCGGQCGACLVAQQCSGQFVCFPAAVTEVCDNGIDDDLDGKVDVSDIPWCDDKKVATLGLSFTAPAFIRIVTGATVNGQSVSWEGNVQGNFTLELKINGLDAYGKVWVNGTAFTATSPQGFIAWGAGVSQGPPPAWPPGAAQGFTVPPGGSYSVNGPAGWTNFSYAGKN